jgi:DNA-binding transcriptional LysR family regulator
VRDIGAEKFVVTAAPGNELPGTPPTVRIADLADHLWVHYTPPSGLFDMLDAACERASMPSPTRHS